MNSWSRFFAIGALGAALAAGTAAAQTVVVEPAPVPPPTGVPDPVQSAGSFDRLSTGNQKIARSLFEAQTIDPNAPAPLNLDQIAALKTGAPATAVSPGTTGTGWGNAFKQMQSQGLIDARNLGQVVSGHYTPPATAATTTAATSSGVVVTNGSGKSFVAGGKGNGNANASGKAGITTASGSDSGKMAGVSNGKGSAKGPQAVTTAGSSAGAGAGAAGGSAKGGGGGKANGHNK